MTQSKNKISELKPTRDDQGKWQIEGLEWEPTYEHICDMLMDKTPFAFSRYGDGEWNAIFQDTGKRHNCDQHQYFPDMGARLADIIKSNPEYMMGIQPLAIEQKGEQIEKYCPDIEWVNSDALHSASIDSRLEYFFNALETREDDITLVCPPHLTAFAGKKGWKMIVVPEVDCWNGYEDCLNSLCDVVDEGVGRPIILFCASMMSNVLIDNLAPTLDFTTLIDAGSIFEPYAGFSNRSYHKNILNNE